jgi:phosphatidate cytidylyltransferase
MNQPEHRPPAAPATGVAPTDLPPRPADDPPRPPGDPAAPAAVPPGKRQRRAGRNLPAAIAVGLGLGAVILATLFLYRPSFAVLVGIVVLYAGYELGRALQAAGLRPALPVVFAGSVAILVAAWFRGADGLVLAVLLTACAALAWRLGDGAARYAADVSASVLILLYVPTLAGFAVLSVHASDGAARILAFVATVVCSDTGGYATGVLFGRHPLAPAVSKAKTWEGFAGSVLFCAVSGLLFLTLTFHQAWWRGLLFGLAIVVTATLGDLGESLVKRDLGIKDMGTLLPGHGGIMDRLDSMLPCAAVGYLLLSLLAPS